MSRAGDEPRSTTIKIGGHEFPVSTDPAAIGPVITGEVVQVQEPATGSLPILAGTVAAIKEDRKRMERTTAEQRRDDLDDQLAEIALWWETMTRDDIEGCLAKAAEYGAGDLEMMGAGLLMLQGDVWDGSDENERKAVGIELAILFYIHGKMARALAAAQQGKRCSDDTIKDLRIYSVMLERVRKTGKWVG